jgi:hypothetical protein
MRAGAVSRSPSKARRRSSPAFLVVAAVAHME